MNNQTGSIKEIIEEIEKKDLSEYAQLSSNSRGRKIKEQESPIRTVYMRDRDRIIHSSSFRRLKDKTQVFIFSPNNLLRTRLTHTLEVSQISRTIAKALRLNEDLVEAIALGHDLGHSPFGHVGERTLSKLFKSGFRHNIQSLRVVDFLEKNGQGLNLSYEVRDGILKHSKWGERLFETRKMFEPITLEGQIVKICDRVAYINHDLDDALRFGLIKKDVIPLNTLKILGHNHSNRINTIVVDIVNTSRNKNLIMMSNKVLEAIEETRLFLFEKVYRHKIIENESKKAERIISELFHFYKTNPKLILKKTKDIKYKFVSLERRIVDYISMMTDEYALYEYKKYMMPKKLFRVKL
ncbi:MAG TPA: deoxyguanosinetriphosphate triphosphohydrolase [Spirochaetota bacterium]|nr:deoxyguanosinetriphosphate triphosphohydrolase [Spirochaetota bacterium]HOM37953.1 deoxyguanosinetriphosphate triphosphohydrolase [Spirochaetota bacterium]HPQ48758.1 deoxyguanosinetriphosphate triphosphohydrolase [Spirochaetota bacterium]